MGVAARDAQVETSAPQSEAPPADFGRGGFVSQNTWFPLAHVSKVGQKPLSRMIGRTSIVLWRDGEGRIRALEDRCRHRRAPLSLGKVTDGTLQCGYHGWRYDGAGRCVKIPSLAAGHVIPEGISVPSFAIAERYGFVWLWWGDPKSADQSLIPDVPFLDPHRGVIIELEHVFETASELVVENLLDMTHTDFVHGGLFGDPSAGDEDVSVESTDEVVTMNRVASGRTPPALLRPFLGFPKRISYHETMRIHLRSGTAFGIAWIDPPGWGTGILLGNIPESPGRTRQCGVAVALARPRRAGGKGGRLRWFELLVTSWGTRVVSRQDQRMLGGQFPAYQADELRVDRSVPADVAGLRFRKLRAELIQRQRAGDLSYAPGWQGSDCAEVMRCDRVE
jgi:phenylpropionate dioxygenase-like ring-hydroxylating dioxygenase large terminal subunit